AGGLVMPPSQAGMVPAALPAFSAPTGVSSPPSLAASSGLTAAWAMPVASTAAPAMAARVNFCLVFILCLPVASEGILDGERREVRSEEHTSELQSRENLVCRLLLEKK